MMCSDVLPTVAYHTEVLRDTLMLLFYFKAFFNRYFKAFLMKRHCFEPHELFMLDDSKIKPVHTVGAVSSFCSVFGFYLRLAF